MLLDPRLQQSALGLGMNGLAFGCDYNPEQWPRDVWVEDVALMRQAAVNLVAINIFGWSQVEPRQGEFDFSGLDAIIDLLHETGIGVNFGTGTSSPPPWLSTRHPEILPVVADGTTRWPGGRQAWCPSSPVFRERALALVAATAQRYGSHPAIRLWHVSNELGCHNALCYCDVSAASFRRWLQERYGSIAALNEAWGTSFWSQSYGDWDEILPPRATLSFVKPTQTVDFARFSSDELLDYFRAEAAVIRQFSAIPVTTNFMVTAHIKTQDYWAWAPEMDVVANAHYLDHRLARPEVELYFAADTTRGLAGGAPWLLMEHSAGAVNWQPRNIAKSAGQMLRDTVAHVARGADGVCFFQWRASLKGTEKFHSALLPHAGQRSRIWRESVELGALIGRLGELSGSRVQSRVALVFSWQSWWAADLEAHPTVDLSYLEQVHAAYGALWDLNVTVDVVAPGASLDGYAVVVVPGLYLVSADEFVPLPLGGSNALSDGATGTVWTEPLEFEGAETVLAYAEGPLEGRPAVTRNAYGAGSAWYVSTVMNPDALVDLLRDVVRDAGVDDTTGPGAGVEVVRRSDADHDWTFVLNHRDESVRHGFAGFELVFERDIDGTAELPAGGTHIIRTRRNAS